MSFNALYGSFFINHIRAYKTFLIIWIAAYFFVQYPIVNQDKGYFSVLDPTCMPDMIPLLNHLYGLQSLIWLLF